MATSIVKLFSRSCAHKYRFNNRHVGCRPLSGVTKEYGNDTADTDIARLKPSLRRRLKHLPPIRDEDVPPEDRTKNHGDRNYGPAIDYFKRDKVSNFDSKLYAKFGAVSKVNPSSLWPSETVIEVSTSSRVVSNDYHFYYYYYYVYYLIHISTQYY